MNAKGLFSASERHRACSYCRVQPKILISEYSCDLHRRHYLNALLFVKIRGQIKPTFWCKVKTMFLTYKTWLIGCRIWLVVDRILCVGI